MPHQQPVLEVIAADGHRFELIKVMAEIPRARIQFLPGMGLSARQYIPFGQALAEHGIECCIHEWRGLGSSSLRASRAINWGYRELLELDLVAAQDRIEAEGGEGPLIVAGHSLGSQLACLLAAMRPEKYQGIAVIAGGSPYWRTFGWLKGSLLLTALTLMPGVASLVGHYPGRRLGFAGREARGVIADWTRTGRSGRYQPPGISQNLEAAMAQLAMPTLALPLADDWFVPEPSLNWLTAKLGQARLSQHTISSDHPGQPANHFSWMQQPRQCAQAIADWVEVEFYSTEANSRA